MWDRSPYPPRFTILKKTWIEIAWLDWKESLSYKEKCYSYILALTHSYNSNAGNHVGLRTYVRTCIYIGLHTSFHSYIYTNTHYGRKFQWVSFIMKCLMPLRISVRYCTESYYFRMIRFVITPVSFFLPIHIITLHNQDGTDTLALNCSLDLISRIKSSLGVPQL
jgi:hypothetical protein